jgi:hypothetical protein
MEVSEARGFYAGWETMSNYGQLSPALGAYNNAFVRLCKGVFPEIAKRLKFIRKLVELSGIEPLTSTLPVSLEKSIPALIFLEKLCFRSRKVCKSLPNFGPVWAGIGVRA